MKQSNRILAYSALALLVMLAAFGAIAFDTSNVAYAQGTGTVPTAPTLTAVASTTEAKAIDLSWNAVDDAVNYELWAWDSKDEWQRLDVGDDFPLIGTSFTHSDLFDGRTYYYQIRAINSEGGMSGWSERVNEVAGDAPDRPELTATAGYEQITVSWAEVTGAARYELWAWDGAWAQLDGGAADSLEATFYTQTGLTAGRTIYYQARAVNAGGVMSAWSAQVSTTVLTQPTTSAPQTLVAASGNGEVTLTWTAPADDGGLGIDGYQYRYGETGSALPETWTDADDVLTVDVTGLTNGQGYDFEVRAMNSGGNGPAATASATPEGESGAPQSLAAVATSHDMVTLTWTAPADDGGLAVTGYEYRSYETSGTALDAWEDAGAVLTVDVTGLTKNTDYTFEVRAMNSAGSGPATSATATTLRDAGAPQSLTADATSHDMVTLTWTAPADDGGLTVTGYEYRSYETGGTALDAWEDAGAVFTVDVTGLTKNTDYTFEVRAMNSAGSGPATSATATTLREPDAPGALTAASGDGEVKLTWAAPANNGGLTVTSYEYQYYETGATATDNWTDVGDVLTATVPNLTNRTEYTFEVRAINPAGPGAAEPKAGTPSSNPSKPQNLTATGGPGSITLSWNAPADNGGSAIVSYRIEKYNATSTNWGHLNTVSGTIEEEYIDNSVTIGATTEYRVRAMNANTNDPSDWATVSGVAQGEGVPSAPQNVKGTPSSGKITFSWDAPASDGGSAITKYEYKYWLLSAQEPMEEEDWIDAGFSTSRTISNLTKNSQYNFKVRAVNDIGNGDTGTTDPLPTFASTRPDVPRRFEAQADLDEATIELSWRKPDDDGGADVDGYELEFSLTEEDGSWANVTGYDSAATNDDAEHGTTEAPLLSGQTYYYRVRTLNARSPVQPEADEDLDTESDLRVWATANATTPSAAPDTPDAPTTTFRDGRITITWEPPRENGQPITRYRLRWRSQDDGANDVFPAANVVSVDAPAIEYIMIGPEPDQAYLFQVQAINVLSEDDSPWSASNDIPLNVAPPALQTLTDPDGLSVSDATDGRATITWRMVADTNYTIASYDLQWVTVGPADGDPNPPTSLANDADEWDDAADPENLAAQALMQRIIGPLPGNTTLFVRLRVVTTVGQKSEWTSTPVSKLIDTRAPNHPDPTATIIGQNVILSWEKPITNGATLTQYELQFKIGADGEFGDHDGADTNGTDDDADEDTPDNDVIIIAATETSYSHENLEADETYTYRIRTVTAENEVLYSETGATLATALAGRTWSAEVEAQSDPGPSADPVAPGTPVLSVLADNTDGDIDLTWEEPSKGSSDITGYQLQRWNGSVWENLPASLDGQDTEFSDTTAELGRRYWYAIRAVSSAGMGEWTQGDFQNDMLFAEAPEKIELSLNVDDQAITLSWDAPDANGAPIVDYQIQFTTTGPDEDNRAWNDGEMDSDTVINPAPNDATTYTHSDLTPGRTYYYRIRAVNACNDDDAADGELCGAETDGVIVNDDADWSDEEDETTEPIAPIAPGNPYMNNSGTNVSLAALAAGDIVDVAGEISLKWELPGPDVDPTNQYHLGTGGAPITSVEIQRWNSSTGQWQPIKTIEVATTRTDPEVITTTVYTPDSQRYTDKGLDDGKEYTYRVRAVNVAGEGPWSNMLSDRTAASAPDMPELTATPDGQNIVLTWTVPDNNGAAITSYQIQRFPSIDAQGMVDNDWGDDAADPTTEEDNDLGGTSDNDVIVPMPKGVTTHTDRDLQPGTTYFYRIRAVNACNDAVSDAATLCGDPDSPVAIDANTPWSSEVQVTTAPKAPSRIADDPLTLDDTDVDGNDLVPTTPNVVENYEGLVLTPGDKKITLSWTAPANNGSTISEYQIERWNSVAAPRMWELIKDELPVSVTSYVDDNDGNDLEAGTRYFYRIRAVNAGGAGAWSTLTFAVTKAAAE